MSNCVVTGCNSVYNKVRKVRFHSFPPDKGDDAERRRLWIKFVNRKKYV